MHDLDRQALRRSPRIDAGPCRACAKRVKVREGETCRACGGSGRLTEPDVEAGRALVVEGLTAEWYRRATSAHDRKPLPEWVVNHFTRGVDDESVSKVGGAE